MPLQYQFQYERNLPHYQPHGGRFFITSRLAGSLPHSFIEQLHHEAEALYKDQLEKQDPEARKVLSWKHFFNKLDEALGRNRSSPDWLKNPEIANVVVNAIKFYEHQRYVIDAFCLMPNHIHLVIKPLPDQNGDDHSLALIMKTIKGFTARKCNGILHRHGDFWLHENFDHCIRDDDEFFRIIRYVIENPVKAGLVEDWLDWPWTYVREGLI
jgi:REP element-mobilizing transposase RayT